MKTTALATIAAAILCASAFAHERITIGPNGGRVIYVDSTSTPNVEFFVNKDGRAKIALLDKSLKPIALAEQSLVVTAGPRASARKLSIEKRGDAFLTETMPAGAPYTVIMQLKENPGSKAMTLRVNYNPVLAGSGKPQYLDDSVNDGSGPSIKPPATLDGLFAEINQHHAELTENFKEKAFEGLDEVTQSFAVLLKALPAKSGNKAPAVQPQVDALIIHLDAIAEANAARTLGDAAKDVESFNAGIASLKAMYPETTANAKL